MTATPEPLVLATPLGLSVRSSSVSASKEQHDIGKFWDFYAYFLDGSCPRLLPPCLLEDCNLFVPIHRRNRWTPPTWWSLSQTSTRKRTDPTEASTEWAKVWWRNRWTAFEGQRVKGKVLVLMSDLRLRIRRQRKAPWQTLLAHSLWLCKWRNSSWS